jgi:hypothetical protein
MVTRSPNRYQIAGFGGVTGGWDPNGRPKTFYIDKHLVSIKNPAFFGKLLELDVCAKCRSYKILPTIQDIC